MSKRPRSSQAAAQPAIVCLGEPLIEFNQGGAADPGADPEVSGVRYLQGFGGDTSNCAIAAARQGASVGYLTQIGSDPFGDRLLELWRREGVDASRVLRHPEAPTGIYFVSHGADGHLFSYYRDGSAASLLGPDALAEDYIAGARLLHVSGISQAISDSACDAVFQAIEIARGNGVLVSYDTNLRLRLWPLARARATIHSALACCDIALPGLDDAVQLTGQRNPDSIVDAYLALGPSVVALTLGADGVLVATAERRERIAPPDVETVDATGAGDTFDGAFLAELVAGSDPFEAAAYANVAAALATEGYGAVTPMPTREAVEQRLLERRYDGC